MQAESFGYKSAWIAARDVRPEALAEALALRAVRDCDWETGLAAAYDDVGGAVFVTPAIVGWVLCVGFALTAPFDERPPAFGARAAEWAARLQTEVHYFATHRVVEAHGWARARPSGLERAYLYVGESGEKVLDEGPQTEEERALGFAFFDPASPEAAIDGYWERPGLVNPGEDHVMALAGRWSVDPSTLGERNLDLGTGLIGEFGEPRPAAPPPAVPTSKPWWKVW